MIEKEIDIEIFVEQNVVLCLWDFWIDAPVEPHKDDVAYSLYNLTKFNLLNQHDIIDGGNYIEDKDINYEDFEIDPKDFKKDLDTKE